MDEYNKHADLGPWTKWLFDSLLVVFQRQDMGFLIGVGIIGFAIAVVVMMFVFYSKKYIQIRAVLHTVRKFQDRQQFTENFETVAQRFGRSALLKRAWREFDETLIQPPGNSNFTEPRYEKVQNTRRPHEYFNAAVIPALQIKPFIAPSTFVGIGLLLTFIGLVAALTAASTAFSDTTANSDTIELAINNLLIVAGAKFFSSIGGLAASILVTVSSKFMQHRLQNLTNDLCDDLESRLFFVSQTQVASDQYAHAIRQTARLEELKDQLAVSIGEQLTIAMQHVPEQMAGALGMQMTPVIDAIDNMSKNLSAGLGDAIVESAGGASAEARDATNAAMESIADQLQNAGLRIEQATRGISNSGGSLQENLESSGVKFGELMDRNAEQFASLLNGASTTADSLNSAASEINRATGTIPPMLASVKQIQQTAEETGRSQAELLTQFRADIEQSRKTVDQNAAQTKELVDELRELWGSQAEQLKLSDEQLISAFEQIDRMSRQSTQNLNDQLTVMDSAVSSISSHLNNSQSSLIEAVESLDDSISKLPGSRN